MNTLKLGEKFSIEGAVYEVMPHPNPQLRNMAYRQVGSRGEVYKLHNATTNHIYALKTFKTSYRTQKIVDSAITLKKYRQIDGLKVTDRTIITRQTYPDLIKKHAYLEYSVLMPWIEGTTWHDVICKRKAFNKNESLQWASKTAHILFCLEQKGLAHCDIAGANIVLGLNMDQVQLVDVEEMYGPGFPFPEKKPAGQEGYQHQTSLQLGTWHEYGDRFASAILIAEMLSWHDDALRAKSEKVSLFAPKELQDKQDDKYLHLQKILKTYDNDLVELFEQAWLSSQMQYCPKLAEWVEVIQSISPSKNSPVIDWRPISRTENRQVIHLPPPQSTHSRTIPSTSTPSLIVQMPQPNQIQSKSGLVPTVPRSNPTPPSLKTSYSNQNGGCSFATVFWAVIIITIVALCIRFVFG